MTKIISYEDKENLIVAANAIKKGELVIFPTETVYGIGANALDSNAVKKIFEAKGRMSDNPLIVHVSDFEMLKSLVAEINEVEKKLIDAFMPGPFTLILKKENIIPDIVTSSLDTVGIRMPENEIARSLIKLSNYPIAAPSANISGKPSGTNIEDIKDEFMNKVSYIIDGGSSKIGLESTVCKVINDIPTILRPGKITSIDIKKVCGNVMISNNIDKVQTEIVESPGLKYKHYAPKTKCILVYSKNINNLIEEINNHLTQNTVIIGSSKLENKFNSKFLNYGDTLESIAHNIFSLIRKADTLDVDLIIIEGVSKEGLGLAIMNRLLKASSYNYFEC